MRFASIGSGSAGNGLVIEQNNTRLLLDCGFGLRESTERLARINLQPDQLTGILVTHEHEDHAGGVFKLANKFNLATWMTYGTYKMLERSIPKDFFQINLIDGHTDFSINDIKISPFPVPHDAREPVQYVFSDGNKKLGVLTDTGRSTPHIEYMLSSCDAMVLECNHDIDMLMKGPYPRSLKQRVSGRLGHLDNQTAAEILSKIDTSRLQHIVAAHLSEKNNTVELAITALSESLNCEKEWISVASQAQGFDWKTL